MATILWHIELSNFNEKARWALDFKGIPHELRAPLPGAHGVVALLLTRGAGRRLPIIELDGRRISDSTAIIAALEAHQPEPALYPADVADDKAVGAAVARFADAYGGIDIAVNAAGIDGPSSLEDLTPEIWRQQLDVNLSGTFYVTREAALRMMAGDGGVVINVSSELGLVGMGLYAHYCASKFGVIGLTKALALELAPKVRVNCICPGPIDTPMMDAELAWFPDPVATRKMAIDRVPLKRFASPQEVAAAVLFFAADAPFATGSVFSLDGGTTAV